RDHTAAQAINETVVECLEKSHLPREAFQLNARFSPPFCQEVRKKSDRAESENRKADDVLQRHQLRPGVRRRWDEAEIRQIHIREVKHRTRRRGHKSSAALEQDARHHDLEKI